MKFKLLLLVSVFVYPSTQALAFEGYRKDPTTNKWFHLNPEQHSRTDGISAYLPPATGRQAIIPFLYYTTPSKGVTSPTDRNHTWYICSGGRVAINNRMYGLTANHCIRDGTQIKVFGMVGAINSDDHEFGQFFLQDAIDYRTEIFDSVVFKETNIESITSEHIRALKLGTSLNVGDEISMIGYPHGEGPFKVTCKYLGLHPIFLASLDKEKYSLFGRMHCEGIRKTGSLGGISGALVINEYEEVVGIVSAGSDVNEDGSVNQFFTPVLEDNIEDYGNGVSFDFSDRIGNVSVFTTIKTSKDEFEATCNFPTDEKGYMHGLSTCKGDDGKKTAFEFNHGILVE